MARLEAMDKKIVDGFVNLVKKRFGGAISGIILFGSKARGESRGESDIDVLIIVDVEDKRVKAHILNLSWQAMHDNNFKAFISPVIFLKKEYEQYRSWNSSFLRNVDKEGVRL